MKKVIAVSCCMVVPMVIIMSFYGRSGSLREIRRVECTANHLADQYSEELYYGVAVSADRCRTACEKSIPYGISGRNRTCGVIYRILGL